MVVFQKKKNRASLTQEYLDSFFTDIDTGKFAVVLKESCLHSTQERTDDSEADLFFDFIKFANKYSIKLKKFCSKLCHTDFFILEQIFNCDENTLGPVPAIIDTSSIKEHSTGWTAWDNPFEISALGAFKAAATYQLSAFLKLSKSIMAAAIVGSQTELISAQYLVTGRTVIQKKWYGSYAIRYNLRTLTLEVPWIKFKKCGPEERVLVELKRKDRILLHKKPMYYHPETIIPPFVSMDLFLADYEKGFIPPERTITKPIKLG